jgi:hypothetical protein
VIGKSKEKSDREKVKAVASAAGSRARRPRACGFDVAKIHGLRDLNPRPFWRPGDASAQHREGVKTYLYQKVADELAVALKATGGCRKQRGACEGSSRRSTIPPQRQKVKFSSWLKGATGTVVEKFFYLYN